MLQCGVMLTDGSVSLQLTCTCFRDAVRRTETTNEHIHKFIQCVLVVLYAYMQLVFVYIHTIYEVLFKILSLKSLDIKILLVFRALEINMTDI